MFILGHSDLSSPRCNGSGCVWNYNSKAGYGEKPGDDYIMAAEDVAKVAVLMAALPDE